MIAECHVSSKVIFCLLFLIILIDVIHESVCYSYLTPSYHGNITYLNENKFGLCATYEYDSGYILQGSKC